jgi:5'-nucleotidase
VLLTNDDGIEAQGLKILETHLADAGAEVVVVAPDRERSGSSHSVTLRQPLKISEAGPGRFSISGTPVDAAHIAVNHVLRDRRPDLIISGINKGANMGCDIQYSGTVAAAREGAMLGVPSFAISLETFQDHPDFGPSARFALSFAERLIGNSVPHRTYFNINLPDLPEENIKGTRITTQGIRVYENVIHIESDKNGDQRCSLGGTPQGGERIADSDIAALERGYVSVTPLRLDLTQECAMDWLQEVIGQKESP